jgi:hypothetical protein
VWKKNELHPPLDFEQKKLYLKFLANSTSIAKTMNIRTASTAAYFYGFFFFPLSSVGTC